MSEQEEDLRKVADFVRDALIMGGDVDVASLHGTPPLGPAPVLEQDMYCGLCGMELEGPYGRPPTRTWVHLWDGIYNSDGTARRPGSEVQHMPRPVKGQPIGPLAPHDFWDGKWTPPPSISFDVRL